MYMSIYPCLILCPLLSVEEFIVAESEMDRKQAVSARICYGRPSYWKRYRNIWVLCAASHNVHNGRNNLKPRLRKYTSYKKCHSFSGHDIYDKMPVGISGRLQVTEKHVLVVTIKLVRLHVMYTFIVIMSPILLPFVVHVDVAVDLQYH